jgi:N6-L-threonylcarbamoyladenine synthase
MTILGIETSCDETAAAVWQDGRLKSNIVASQAVHIEFGGVVPELASRAHMQTILPVIRSALNEAGVTKRDLDAVAVTYGPGLMGSLVVGVNVAKSMAMALGIPWIGINHLEGHLFSTSVEADGPQPPFLALIISGGHTLLVHVHEWGDYTLLGQTRDDAVGETFDKVAKMLDLPYPGGPEIDRLASKGDPGKIDFPQARFKDSSEYAFSYSGLKTAVLYHLHQLPPEERRAQRADIAASFQRAAIESLLYTTLRALEDTGLSELVLAGGVARNRYLRTRLQELAQENGITYHIPSPILCTDNAAMIARAAAFRLERGEHSGHDLSPDPSLDLKCRKRAA